MSIFYSISTELQAEANKDNIYQILKYGTSLHCKYIDEGGNLLTPEQAVQHIFLPNEDDLHGVTWMLYDTGGSLLFHLFDPATLRFSFSSLSDPWRKDFDISGLMNDHARYVRFLITLCKNFIIKNIGVWSDMDLLGDMTTPNMLGAALEISNAKLNTEYISSLLRNAYFNSFALFKNIHEPFMNYEEAVAFIEAQYNKHKVAAFFMKVHNQFINVELHPYRVYFYPILPLKQQIMHNEAITDVIFYVETLLNFCENVGILELKVNL